MLNVYRIDLWGAERQLPPLAFDGAYVYPLGGRRSPNPLNSQIVSVRGAQSDPTARAFPTYSGRPSNEAQRVEYCGEQENQSLTGSAGPPAREMQGKEPEGCGVYGEPQTRTCKPKILLCFLLNAAGILPKTPWRDFLLKPNQAQACS